MGERVVQDVCIRLRAGAAKLCTGDTLHLRTMGEQPPLGAPHTSGGATEEGEMSDYTDEDLKKAHRLVIENRGCKESGEDCTRFSCGVTVASCEAWRVKIATALRARERKGRHEAYREGQRKTLAEFKDAAHVIEDDLTRDPVPATGEGGASHE